LAQAIVAQAIQVATYQDTLSFAPMGASCSHEEAKEKTGPVEQKALDEAEATLEIAEAALKKTAEVTQQKAADIAEATKEKAADVADVAADVAKAVQDKTADVAEAAQEKAAEVREGIATAAKEGMEAACATMDAAVAAATGTMIVEFLPDKGEVKKIDFKTKKVGFEIAMYGGECCSPGGQAHIAVKKVDKKGQAETMGVQLRWRVKSINGTEVTGLKSAQKLLEESIAKLPEA